MKKLLISGFEPFGGESINPSWEAVSRLPETIGEYAISKILIPVVFEEAAKCILDVAQDLSPDVIISVGQAGGRNAITPEMVAINLRHASIPDNNGNQPQDATIIQNGPAAYFTTLPVRKISDAIKAQGIASNVSYSAGAYVCNDVLYTLLDFFNNQNIGVGFIHIPYSDGQNREPSMPLNDIIKGLTIAIENID